MNEKTLSWAAIVFATITMVCMIVAVTTMGALVGGNNQSSTSLGRTGSAFPNGLCTGAACSATAGGLNIGSSGTSYTLVKSGTCVLTSNASIVATSTGQGTCATTGSLAGDIVYLNLATTTTAITKQFVLLPNTFAGTDTTTVTVQNLTGANGVPAAIPTLGSSTQYQIFRAQ